MDQSTPSEDHGRQLPPMNGQMAGAPITPASPSAPRGLAGLLGRLGHRAQAPSEQPAVAPPTPAAAPAGVRLSRRRTPDRSIRKELPAWLVSVVVHASVLLALAAATQAPRVAQAIGRIDAAEIDTTLSATQAEELVHILADPVNAPRQFAAAELTSTPGLGGGLTAGGAPSATPMVSGPALASADEASASGTGVPVVEIAGALSGMALKPPSSLLTREIGGGLGGLVAGDVGRPVTEVGEALDQLAREILRHVSKHKLTVIWLFDESKSMKDDQQAIKEKFDRVCDELARNFDPERASDLALTHVIAGFGSSLHYELPKPTEDIRQIGRAIDQLRTDETGQENTFHAIEAVIEKYAGLISKDRSLLIVLVTDESADDGDYIEQTRLAAVNRNVPVYIIGRQSLFGRSGVTLPYTDPVTKDVYYPQITRGPETAALECLQYDGLHGRWDEQPSGFAPYELARLTKDTGGIYFLLPSEEELRSQINQREKAYSMATLKEYAPDYESRMAYNGRVARSVLRRTLLEVIAQSREYGFRRHFPIEPGPLAEAITKELPKVEQQLVLLGAIEKRLRSLRGERDREPEKRWQAHYDLILAQIAAYQVKAYEYGATLSEMGRMLAAGQLQPRKMPVKGQLVVEWVVDHNKTLRASQEKTGKQIAEATRLLELVVKDHPKSPWADLAQDELNRGFGCQWSEWHHSPKYDERAKLVPKY